MSHDISQKLSVAIYTSEISNNIETIWKLKLFFMQNNRADDFVIFSDIIHDVRFNNFSIVQSYEMRFFKGSVVFLNISDYEEHKNILANKILCLNMDSLDDKTRDVVNNLDCELLSVTNDGIVSVGK